MQYRYVMYTGWYYEGQSIAGLYKTTEELEKRIAQLESEERCMGYDFVEVVDVVEGASCHHTLHEGASLEWEPIKAANWPECVVEGQPNAD